MIFYGGRNFLKRKLSSPKPLSSKNLENGVLFFAVITTLNARTTYVRTTPIQESF